jgi:hypothetical protein
MYFQAELKKSPNFKYPQPAVTARSNTIFKTPGFQADTVATEVRN